MLPPLVGSARGSLSGFLRARDGVTEQGGGGDPDVAFLDSRGRSNGDYIHAAAGELGTVESIHDDAVFVCFDRTGTASIVSTGEVEPVCPPGGRLATEAEHQGHAARPPAH